MNGDHPHAEPPPLPERPFAGASTPHVSENPFAPPTTESAAHLSQREAFPQWDTKTLRKVYSDFATMRAMTLFWFIFGTMYAFALLEAVAFLVDPEPNEPYRPFIMTGIGLGGCLLLSCAILNICRHPAARALSYICSALLLPLFPLGTIIGGFALQAYGRSGKYAFGKEAIAFRDLKREYRRRRKLRID
ncbi:hypothetical protein JCM19992_03080 [Thermostilla marina]